MERYKNVSNIYFSANNCSINTATEIKDTVHPTVQGYKKMAQTYVETLNFIVNKDINSGIDSVTAAPETKTRLNTFAPITLPTPRDARPFFREVMVVTSSGREVPRATNSRATTVSGTPSQRAMT